MTTKRKPWSEMTTDELAAATKMFDDPSYRPAVLQASRQELAALRRVQRKSKNRFRIALALEKSLVEQTDTYAANHGVTFSDVVSDALRKHMRKKSA